MGNLRLLLPALMLLPGACTVYPADYEPSYAYAVPAGPMYGPYYGYQPYYGYGYGYYAPYAGHEHYEHHAPPSVAQIPQAAPPAPVDKQSKAAPPVAPPAPVQKDSKAAPPAK